MKNKRGRSWLWRGAARPVLRRAGLVLLITTWVSATQQARAEQQSMVAVTHADLHVELNDRRSLRSIFSLRTRSWPDGTPVRVFVFEDQDPRHAAFCKSILGTYPYILRRSWDRNLFAGTGLVPETVRDAEDMLHKVSHTPGGIGYLPESEIPESLLPEYRASINTSADTRNEP